MRTKEEILNSHPYLRVWFETPDDSSIRCCNEEHALWAMEEYAKECAREKCTLPIVSDTVCPNCGGKDIRPYKGHYCCYECSEFFKQTEC